MAWQNWKNVCSNFVKNRTLLGYTICIISLTSNVIGISCIQALDGEVPIFEMTSLRYLAQLIIGLPWQLKEGCKQSFSRKYFSMSGVALFSLANILGNITMTASPVLLAAGVYTALVWAVTLNIITLVAIIFFSERRKYVYLAVLLCMAGCLLVTQPFGNEVQEADENWHEDISTIHEHAKDDKYSSLTNATRNKLDIGEELILNVSISKSGNDRQAIAGNSGTVYLIGLPISEVLRRPLGCVLAVLCGVLSSMYVLIQKHALQDTSVMILNFWSSALGTAACAVLSVAMESVTWPNSWRSSVIFLSYVTSYGKSHSLHLCISNHLQLTILSFY